VYTERLGVLFITMCGVDELISSADESAEEEQVEDITDELGIDDKEELEELDDRLDRAYELILQYDNRIEQLEEEVKTLRATIVKLITEEHEQHDSDSTDRPDSDEELLSKEENNPDLNNGLEWD